MIAFRKVFNILAATGLSVAAAGLGSAAGAQPTPADAAAMPGMAMPAPAVKAPALPAPVRSSEGTHAAPMDPTVASMEMRNWHARTGQLVRRTWGVEVLGVRLTSSNWMLNFRYKIEDADKARVLQDAKATAYLIDESSGARLSVPAMENIGDLRQSSRAKAGRDYYIMFGNANQVVRKGSKVDVVIGAFHADGLVVQ